MNRQYIADFHVHSSYSRATSPSAHPTLFAHWARLKGISILGTGDITHPEYILECESMLEEHASGIYTIKENTPQEILPGYTPHDSDQVKFILTGEISTIYKYDNKVRKVHSIVVLSSIERAKHFSAELGRRGNVSSDGRPILGMDTRDLYELLLSCDKDAYLIPAHIWTPWFSLLGDKGGFDSLEECFRDMTPYVFAAETGLSSDPLMNMYVPFLDNIRMISNSDAHSPAKLGREATLFSFDTEPDYFAIKNALVTGNGFSGTIEFFPEEGKYHNDGHRKCDVSLDPHDAIALDNICPVCGKPLTVGVYHRVLELGNMSRDVEAIRKARPQFSSIIPLDEVLGEILGSPSNSPKVARAFSHAVKNLESDEFSILTSIPVGEIARSGVPLLDEAVKRIREGKVIREPGYDGDFGVISVFESGERDRLLGQSELFAFDASLKPAKKKPTKAGSRQKESEGKVARTPDEFQMKVIESEAQFIAVEAGPGSGKTFTLIEKYLHDTDSLDPSRTGVITFTTRAAAELSARFSEKTTRLPFIGTFHSLALGVIRGHAGTQPKILAPSRAKALLMDLGSADPSSDYKTLCRHAVLMREPDIECAAAYREFKAKHDLADFDDLIARAAELNRTKGSLYDTLFIDEFQDINALEYDFIQSFGARRIVAIGDRRQNIYAFKGSLYELFDRFANEFNAETHSLSVNYRSAVQIVDLSNAVMNSSHPMSANRQKSRSASAVRFGTFPGPQAEARFIAEEIVAKVGGTRFESVKSGDDRASQSFADIAILVRHRKEIHVYAQALRDQGIPFVIGGEKAPWAHDAIEQLCDDLVEKQTPGWKEILRDRLFSRSKETEVRFYIDKILDSCSSAESFRDFALENQELAPLEGMQSVRLLTCHASKGLEFGTVFIPSFDARSYPSPVFANSIDEEKRLLYVALTRAKNSLIFSSTDDAPVSIFRKIITPFARPETGKKKKQDKQMTLF